MLLRYLPSLARQHCLRTTTTAASLGRNVWEDLLSIEEPALPGIVGGVLDRWAASGKAKGKRRSSFDGAASPRDAKLRPPPPAVPPAPQLLKGLQGRPDLAAGILAYRRTQVRLSSGPSHCRQYPCHTLAPYTRCLEPPTLSEEASGTRTPTIHQRVARIAQIPASQLHSLTNLTHALTHSRTHSLYHTLSPSLTRHGTHYLPHSIRPFRPTLLRG